LRPTPPKGSKWRHDQRNALSHNRARVHNEVRLKLYARAYNLATFPRCIELPEAMAAWSLTSVQLKLIHRLAGDACITEKED
jgi:hypothetical protein